MRGILLVLACLALVTVAAPAAEAHEQYCPPDGWSCYLKCEVGHARNLGDPSHDCRMYWP